MIFTDFVLENGQLIRVECPQKHEDAFWDSVRNAMKLGDTWSPSQFNGCTAEMLGMRLDRVNMAKVVATL
jgi:hypothetical protein